MGLHLAMIGSINDEILNIEELALEVIRFLVREYPGVLAERYQIEEQEEPLRILEQIAENRRNACKRAAHWTMQRLPAF